MNQKFAGELKLIENIYKIESKALEHLLYSIARIGQTGYFDKKLLEVTLLIGTDTIIRKNIMGGLLKGVKDMNQLQKTLRIAEKEAKPSDLGDEEKAILKMVVNECLRIEKEAEELYSSLANETGHPLIKKLARLLIDNRKSDLCSIKSIIGEED